MILKMKITNFRFFFFFFFILSCQSEKNSYFPLNANISWTYLVEIIPEIESKMVYKKINGTLKEIKVETSQDENPKKLFPILRENNSIYYYSKSINGILREGVQYSQGSNISFEKEKRFVLRYPLEVGRGWMSSDKTFLILRRYPYFDYKATTDFKLNNVVKSLNETVKVPAGKFKGCLKIEANGETTFIGDSEIGTINIKVKTTEWYAPNVGLVKSLRIEETDTDLFGTTKMLQVLDQFKS